MSDFSENVRKAYELYLLGEKQEAFSYLIPGTKHFYYLSIIDAFKRERHMISKETRELVKQFCANFVDEDSKRITLQELFLRYDGAKSDEERDEIIKTLDTNFIYGYYNHPKPADVKGKKGSKDKNSKTDLSLFDQSKYFVEDKIMNKLYSNSSIIYSWHKSLYNKINFAKISESEFLGFLNNCESFAYLSNESFWEKLVSTYDQKRKANKFFSPENYLYDKYTLEQMEKLGDRLKWLKEDTHYIGKMFEKRFHFELDEENKTSFTLEQRREQLISMYDASQNRPQSLRSALLLEILENGIKLDIYDFDYFAEYLKNPLKNWHMNKETQNKAEIHDYNWNQYLSNINNRRGGRMDSGLDRKLYKKYLEQFYLNKGDLENFKEYFDQDFLSNLFEEFEFMAGKEIKKEKIDEKKYESLSNLVLIELLECNKESFKKEDRVKLVCDIKNVSTLHVKIFEFNSENYYRKNLAPFRTDVNLDGLITADEEVHELKEFPQKKYRKVFEFPQLDNKVGLFVIEFISNGYSSRAVIKKGSLSLIYKSTVAGQVGYILDENKEICKTDNTGMWYKNQYFKADPEKGGRIIIPYEKVQTSDKAILIYEGFAQLTEFRRMSENYSFECAYIVQSESFLMGKGAEILLRPCLKVNDRKCNLSILKNIKVTLTTRSFVDNLPVTKTFEDLELNNNQEIPINFQVPPNLLSVIVLIEAEVNNISKGFNDKFQHTFYINMDTKNSGLTFYENYLRKIKDSYYFYILGKNGEPLSDINVAFNFYHKFYTCHTESVTLQTDDDGKIKLGPLTDILTLISNFTGPNGSCSGQFTINNLTEKVNIPDSLNILEDEEIELPFVCEKEFSSSTVALVRLSSSGKVIEYLFEKIKFSHDKGYQYGKISINGLERGHYRLYFLVDGQTISIRVHKGVYWETDSFILKDHSLVEKRERTNIIRVKDILLEEEKDQAHNLSFNIENYGRHPRVHVYAFTFLPENTLNNYSQIERVGKDLTSLDVFPFAKWANIYLSNRKLGDEFRYVFDRKFVKRFMGNTLDRPQLLLNRHKLRDTQFDQEVVKGGSQYDNVDINNYQPVEQMISNDPFSLNNCAPGAYMNQQYDMNSNVMPMSYTQSKSLPYIPSNNSQSVTFKTFQNFLKNSACVMSNLMPDSNGHVECSIDAYKYSTIVVLAVDESSMTQSVIDISTSLEEIEKRDLALSNPLDASKYYNETRISEVLRKEVSHGIEDITSTDYIMIDSIERVQQVMKEIRKAIGTSAGDDLSFLAKWHTYTKEGKNKKYSQFSCHEVNLFVYFKDTEYFEAVVKPYISNKMEKSFIDMWLIGNHDAVVKNKNVDLFDRLNTLEKCLLISEVVKDDKEEARLLADRIKLVSDKNEVRPEQINRIIDTVINLNLVQDKPALPNEILREQTQNISNEINLSSSILDRGYDVRAEATRVWGAPRNMMAMRMPARAENKPYAGESFENDYQDYGQERFATRSKFQETEAASEYAETHYYKNPNVFNPSLINENSFWADFAYHIVNTGSTKEFISSNFIYATQGDTQNAAVLSLLSLPNESQKQLLQPFGSKGVTITAADNLILFKKEIKEAQAELDTNLLVIHRYFESNNRNSEKKIKEFLVHQVYGCETIITNVSTKSQDFQILWQIPEGSLPLQNINYQKSETKKLGPYSTTTFQYFFYFPKAGEFIQFPANITIGEKVIAVANECKFTVVEERKEVSNETFRDILLSGNNDVIEFLSTANLYKLEKGFNFSDILWMLKDKEFFIQVTDTLRKRRIYDDLTWKYGFYHRDEQAMKESISRLVAVLSQCGTYFESSLIKCTPETSNFRHLDYFPMINSRAHKLGDNSNPGILNRQFRETYFKFLKVSVEKNRLDETDWLNFTYYLLIQDRINEAIEIFESKIDPKVFEGQDTLRMQYDYMRAYLDFFTGFETGFKIAKAISRKYADYPVLAWKVLFTEILDQLEEFEEGIDYDEDIDQLDETKRKANLKKSINLEPTMSCELEGKLIKIEYNNIPKISVKYYAIDPEVLFSRAPFLNQNTEDFAYVKPMETQEFTLDKKLKSESFEISQNLQKSNLVIEISGEGKQSFLTYFSTSIKVAINENFGELKVTDTDDKPLAKVYVKVFSSENANSQNSKFFKDGYTDIRGKFEYAQINSKKLASIQKFAILVMSDEHGSLTREAKAPPKIAKEVEECEPYLHSSAVTKLAHQENRRMNKMKMM